MNIDVSHNPFRSLLAKLRCLTVDVSVIVPVFNSAKYLGECLDSILGQSHSCIEVICINDASTDESGELLAHYARRNRRLRIITNRTNIGPGMSRNKGLEAARGSYLMFVDSDDLLPPDAVRTLYSKARNDAVDIVKGSLATFHNGDQNEYRIDSRAPDRSRFTLAEEKNLWIPYWHTSYLIASQLIRDKDIRYPSLLVGEDPVFIATLLVNAKSISSVSHVTYLYRRYEKKAGSGGKTFDHVEAFLRHAEITKKILSDYHPDCWQSGYAPFLLEQFDWLIDYCELSPEQRHISENEIKRIWEM